jgi:large subunit ribosomal protein L25
MPSVSLQGRVREVAGKQASKRLRREGWIPAILYGADTPNVALELERKTLYDSLKHHAPHGRAGS